MRSNSVFILSLVILLATACQKLENELLPGKWQAVEVLEEGKPLDVDASTIWLQLDGNENYTFEGTLNYREAGKYYIQSNLLYTLDTINQASTEKAIEIVTLTPDSLLIKMNEDGKERLLKMTKVDN